VLAGFAGIAGPAGFAGIAALKLLVTGTKLLELMQ